MQMKEMGDDRGRIENCGRIVRREAVWTFTALRGTLS
jgi:hypothetical protein